MGAQLMFVLEGGEDGFKNRCVELSTVSSVAC